MPPAIGLQHLGMAFRDTSSKKLTVLSDVNLEIALGEFFIFVGPSGSGKSTLLRIMSGLETSFDGSLVLAPEITRKDMSFVFQQFALLPWLTIAQNVEIGLIARGVPLEKRRSIVSQELKTFGLEHFAHAYPRELSGGMRQRAGVARALATNPKIIFMDEPFSELDSFTAGELRAELLQIWNERRPTIVMVTHIVEDALELADRIAVLTPRPGHIKKIVTNDLPRPRAKRTEEFFRMTDHLYDLIRPSSPYPSR